MPELDLNKISNDVPIAIFNGQQDNMADPLDVAWLTKRLGDKVVKHVVMDQLDHHSFSVGANMSWVDDVVQFLDQY